MRNQYFIVQDIKEIKGYSYKVSKLLETEKTYVYLIYEIFTTFHQQ